MIQGAGRQRPALYAFQTTAKGVSGKILPNTQSHPGNAIEIRGVMLS